MFEARVVQGSTIKKIVDSMKDLVTDANLDCSSAGFSLQAMDSSHVSLVSLDCKGEGFDAYRCDKPVSIGLNLASMSKVLKCAGNDDCITLKVVEGEDTITMMFESEKQDRISDFELKLMDIDSEHLGIPDTPYKVTVQMPSGDFQRICRDLAVVGDTCIIKVEKGSIRFSASGDLGKGNITRKPGESADDKDATRIDVEEPVELTFALHYLSMFTKATPLSDYVKLRMSPDVPLMVEYPIEGLGQIRYYLAPKIDEEGA